jgi:hypothetical protein
VPVRSYQFDVLKIKGESMNSVNNARQEVQAVRRIDLVVRDEGTIWLFTPLTSAASEFLSKHIQPDAQYFGDSLVVEHRYVEDLLHGLGEHGLKAVRA